MSYIMREMQIKTLMGYHYTSIRMDNTDNRTLITPNAGEDVEQQEVSFIADEIAKWYSRFGRQISGFLQN